MAEGTKNKKTYGLLGRNISYSLSPVMHNAAFRHFGIPAEYEIFDIEEKELEAFSRNRLLSGSISGFNITVPYKVKIKELLEASKERDVTVDKWVKIIGAANTVKINGDKISVYNTDAEGFYKSLTEDAGFDTTRKEVFILGAGGAGRAISLYMNYIDHLDRIYVYDVDAGKLDSLDEARKESVPDKIRTVRGPEDVAGKLKRCDLIINATPIGTREGDKLPLSRDMLDIVLQRRMHVYDLVYARETELVKKAREKGIKAVNGLGMLINQAAKAFKIWTGKPLDEVVKVMKGAVEGA
ncbi:MAG: shikimate dehydrogenase [Candidatus Omnitrophota bacterium]|jgi:shikimate dehydrogenase